ncbi:MAG: hypothetical protein M3R35_07765 [Candidatus Eremiobacteraeota bacterium]|nr:hypothetical protein [Candidatus Eremiobacteraeota bacterium]
MIGLFVLAAATASSPCVGRMQYRAIAHMSAVRVAHTNRGYSASARIAFRLNASKPAATWNVHTRGARTIAQRIVLGAGGTASGFGRTPQAARTALQSDVVSLTHDIDATLARQEETYDRVTENGRQQDQGPLYGFPGGADVTTFCAR